MWSKKVNLIFFIFDYFIYSFYAGSCFTNFLQSSLSFGVDLSMILLSVYYVFIVTLIYRQCNFTWKLVISCIIHPLFVELYSTFLKFARGTKSSDFFDQRIHLFYQHEKSLAFETLFNLYRRFMFNDTNDVNLTTLLVIVSGIQEILSRSCMEWKEVNLRRLLGSKPLFEHEMIQKRKFYSYSVTARSIFELTSIIVAPIINNLLQKSLCCGSWLLRARSN